MKRYWYFASTLPYFSFGSSVPMTIDEFDERCARLIDKDDNALVKLVQRARAGEYSAEMERSAFLKSFLQFECGVRNALVVARAKANKWDPEMWLRSETEAVEVSQVVQAVLSAPDPLQAELTLEHERWNVVERLSALSSFELDYILAYKMKLLIATRCAQFNKERGTEEFDALYHDIIDAAADATGIAIDTGVGS